MMAISSRTPCVETTDPRHSLAEKDGMLADLMTAIPEGGIRGNMDQRGPAVEICRSRIVHRLSPVLPIDLRRSDSQCKTWCISVFGDANLPAIA